MPKEGQPKSAYELAMERLREKDREQGIKPAAPLTERQKEEIAELRRTAEAKLAELQILHQKNRDAATDPEELTKLEERLEIDRRRVHSNLESEIARVRGDK